jgi:hypothetical protein
MRFRTKDALLIEAETSLDVVRRLREASWGEQNLSDQAFMEAVADRMYQQGIHVSTVSADIFVAGLLIAGLLTREIEGARSNETGEEISWLSSWFVGGSWEDYKQKPDHGHAGTVIDHHEALAGISEKAEAISHKAQSRDQSENSEGSQ